MPKNQNKPFAQELINILSKATNSKIYGSVEVFFEAGQITQITQRIINKLARPQISSLHSVQKKPAKTKLPHNNSAPHKDPPDDLPTITRTP